MLSDIQELFGGEMDNNGYLVIHGPKTILHYGMSYSGQPVYKIKRHGDLYDVTRLYVGQSDQYHWTNAPLTLVSNMRRADY